MTLRKGHTLLLWLSVTLFCVSRNFAQGLDNVAIVNVHVTPHQDGFHVNVHVPQNSQFDQQNYTLKLKKPASIFSPDFRFTVLNVNEAGEQELSDHTVEALDGIERHLYVDRVSNAVVRVEDKNGKYKIGGVIDQLKIYHHEDSGTHVVTPIASSKSAQKGGGRINDYIDLHLKIEPMPLTRQFIATTAASPEVLILFDFANYQHFAGNSASIRDYLSVFYHAVQNRFLTVSNPAITIAVTGFFAFSTRAAQPFMESSKIPGSNSYDMIKVLRSLSTWVPRNTKTLGLPNYDVVSLLSGEDFLTVGSDGRYVKGIAGIAYLGGACRGSANQFLGTSVNADKGGYWNGVYTVAHELAHNLNAPHDGDGPGATTCPWTDGYLMSYLGWGTKNKFTLSSCSRTEILNFINSANGACLKTFEASNRWTLSSDNPGDKLDLTAQCRKALGTNSATVEWSPTICLNLKCRVPISVTSYYIYTLNQPPGDNSSCDTNKVCRNGDCVNK